MARNFCKYCKFVRPISKSKIYCINARLVDRDPVTGSYQLPRCKDIRKKYPVKCPNYRGFTEDPISSL